MGKLLKKKQGTVKTITFNMRYCGYTHIIAAYILRKEMAGQIKILSQTLHDRIDFVTRCRIKIRVDSEQQYKQFVSDFISAAGNKIEKIKW